MRAIFQEEYGTTEVLELRDIDRPEVGSGEVLVRVVAAGVDRGAWHVMRGLPYPIRLAGYGVRSPKNPVLGTDLAGVVVAVGPGASAFKVGDEVFGVGKGSYAEYAVAVEDQLALKPATLTFEEAAVIPTSGATALQALRKGRLAAGKKALVIGASGGVGTFTVQIAKALGASVTAVCSTPKVELVRTIGADRVIDYKTTDFTAGGMHYDVIIDIGGNSTLSRMRSVLSETGRLVITGGETDGPWLGGVDRQLRASMLSPFLKQSLGTFIASVRKEDLVQLSVLVTNGKLRPIIDRTYPLGEVPYAMTYLEQGRASGKLVISI